MNKVERFWDKQASRFEKQVMKDEQSFVKIIDRTKAYLNEKDIVLDFACGIGTSSFDMIDYVQKILAMDISNEMIQVAQKRMSMLPEKNIQFIHANLFDEQFKNESFNIVTAFNILHLLENPKMAIRRIHDLLKPEGLFISTTPFLGEKTMYRFIFYIMSKIGNIPHLQSLKYGEIQNLMISEYFEIIEIIKSSQPVPNGFIVAKKKS